MINEFSKNLIRFVILMSLQVIILNNILFFGYINPYLYVMFILMLPFNTPKWLLLVFAFLLGLSMDMFSDTLGMHAAATVFMAFCRPYLLIYTAPRGGYDFDSRPAINYLGLNWYFSYCGILVLLHHIALFSIEVFRISEFLATFYRVIFSTCFTIILIFICQYMIYGSRR